MRILAVTSLFPTPVQPRRAPFNWQQLQALASLARLHVIAPVAWTTELAARRSGVTSWRELSANLTVESPRFYFPPKVLRGTYGPCMRRSIASAFERALEAVKPDVVLGSWAYPDGWAASELARRASLPCAIKVHGSDLLTLGVRGARRRRTAEALERADAVIAVSEHLAEEVERFGVARKRIHLVRNGLDTTLFRPGDRASARAQLGLQDLAAPGTKLLLFVGNLMKVKGPDLLLEAFIRIRQQGLDARLVVVGDGPMRDALGRRSQNVAGDVYFAGPQPLERMPTWFQAADLFVLPSRSEGLPNVLLEATACGTPWIASDVGGVGEIAEADRRFAPGDPEKLAARIITELGSDCRSMSQAGWTPGSWRASAVALADVLKGLVASPPLSRPSSPPVALASSI